MFDQIDRKTEVKVYKKRKPSPQTQMETESHTSVFNVSDLGSKLINPKELETSLISVPGKQKEPSPERELFPEKRPNKIGHLILLQPGPKIRC